MGNLTNRLEDGELIKTTSKGWRTLNELIPAIKECKTLKEVFELKRIIDVTFDMYSFHLVGDGSVNIKDLRLTKEQMDIFLDFIHLFEEVTLEQSNDIREVLTYFILKSKGNK